jgi:uncharacterized protein (DUF58 family)
VASARANGRAHRPGPGPLWERFLRSLPGFTAGGYLALILLLVLGIFAATARNNFVYIVFCLFLSLGLFAFWYPWLSMRRITLERTWPKEIFAGEEVVFGVHLKNESLSLGAYAVTVQDLPDVSSIARFGFSFVFRIPPGGEARASYPIKFRRRGLYRGSRYVLESSFPFGLFSREVHGTVESEFLVYPRIRPLRLFSQGSFLPGVDQISENTFGGPDEFKRLREYLPGDHPRTIHWKSTARYRKLMVRDHERYEKRKVTLVLETTPVDESRRLRSEAVFERAVSLAASAAAQLTRRGHLFRFAALAPERVVTPFHRSPDHLREVLRMLAVLEPAPRSRLPDLLCDIPPAGDATVLLVLQDARRFREEYAGFEGGKDLWVIDAAERKPRCVRAGSKRPFRPEPIKLSLRGEVAR